MEVEGNNDLHPVRFTAQKFYTGVPIREKARWIPAPIRMQQKGEKASISNCEENPSRPVQNPVTILTGVFEYFYTKYIKNFRILLKLKVRKKGEFSPLPNTSFDVLVVECNDHYPKCILLRNISCTPTVCFRKTQLSLILKINHRLDS